MACYEDAMEQFKKGDVVRLKSGGPMMTIEDTGDGLDHGAGHPSSSCLSQNGITH